VRRAQGADRLEDVGLRRDIQAGGRLVEHDHRGLAGERHGEHDALLLAARELMGVATQELSVRGQEHLGHHLAKALPALFLVGAVPVLLEHLEELRVDAQRRVERHRRVLGHVGDQLAARGPQLGRRQLEHVAALEEHLAAGDPRPPPLEGEQRGGGRGLARRRLADEAEDLALVQVERDLMVDLDLGRLDLDLQAAQPDGDLGAHAPVSRSIPTMARLSPSAMRLVPMVRMPISSTGMNTE